MIFLGLLASLARFHPRRANLVGCHAVTTIKYISLALAFITAVILAAFIRGEQVKRVQQDACSIALYNAQDFDFAEGWINE